MALERQDAAAFARLAAHARRWWPAPRPEAPDQPLYTCGAGVTGFTVDPYGALQLCQLSRRNSFDLREGSFDEGWNVLFPKLRARTWQTQSLCRTCELVGLCGSCPGAAELEHGDPEAVVAAFCEIAHARAFATLEAVAGPSRATPPAAWAADLARREPEAAAPGGCGGCGHAPEAGTAHGSFDPRAARRPPPP